LTASESQQDRKANSSRESNPYAFPNSVALSCELDIGVLRAPKVTANLRGPKNSVLPRSDLPGMPRSEKWGPLEPKLRGVNGE
jgi:hypothetical protein